MTFPQPCAVIQLCGGCPLFSLSESEERAEKQRRLRELQSLLKLPGPDLELASAQRRTEYRNRVRLRIDNEGRVAFFNAEKSPTCAVLEPSLRDYVNELRSWSSGHPLALAAFAYLEARAPDLDATRGLYISAKPDVKASREGLDGLVEFFRNQVVATNLDPSMPTQRFDIDGTTFQRVPLNAFLQINVEVNRMLTRHVVGGALRRNCVSFADLYCGSGNFALPLAAAGLRGNGVEFVPSCASAATDAAREQKLDHVRFSEGDAVESARNWLSEDQRFDLVVLDPPRAGVRSGLDLISKLARYTIAYCSCNPDTLLRDLSHLQQLGWRVEELTAFDMFPGTRHLEVVAWLAA